MKEITDSDAEIYGVNQNVRKSVFYQPAIEHSGVESTFNARDRALHARKRRILAPAFTDASLSSMEEYILTHIRKFFESASGQQSFRCQADCWTADIGKWGNYLTFDVMGDLVFGRDFGMIAGEESRELPDIIDAAAHRELLVRLVCRFAMNLKGRCRDCVDSLATLPPRLDPVPL